MKKYICLFLFSVAVSLLQAQNNSSNSILVRHDTTTLKAGDCEWIIKSLAKSDPLLNHELGKSLPLFLVAAIEKGKLKAYDATTNELIPGKKILTWKMGVDSMMTYDDAGNSKVIAVQRQHQTDRIDEIRICHDWYLDVASGKFQAVIKWMELREQIYTATGTFIGYGALCRIFY